MLLNFATPLTPQGYPFGRWPSRGASTCRSLGPRSGRARRSSPRARVPGRTPPPPRHRNSSGCDRERCTRIPSALGARPRTAGRTPAGLQALYNEVLGASHLALRVEKNEPLCNMLVCGFKCVYSFRHI